MSHLSGAPTICSTLQVVFMALRQLGCSRHAFGHVVLDIGLHTRSKPGKALLSLLSSHGLWPSKVSGPFAKPVLRSRRLGCTDFTSACLPRRAAGRNSPGCKEPLKFGFVQGSASRRGAAWAGSGPGPLSASTGAGAGAGGVTREEGATAHVSVGRYVQEISRVSSVL